MVSSARKTFVLDTNILLSDASALSSFGDNEIIIPLIVLEELDSKKNRQDEVGHAARSISRQLNALRKRGNLHDGVELDNGGFLRVLQTPKLPELSSLDMTKVDNALIGFAKALNANGTPCILVSRDINVQLKCDALGVVAEDYVANRATTTKDEIYGGVSNITLTADEIDSFYLEEPVMLDPEVAGKLHPNEILVIKSVEGLPGQSALARFQSPTQPLRFLNPSISKKKVFGLTPRNKEQIFGLDLLLNDSIPLVTLAGAAGCGKSLIAVAAGMEKVIEEGKYEKLVIARPIQSMGNDLGFLPGSKEEKLDPWMAPIKDCMNFLLGSKGNLPEVVKKPTSSKRGARTEDYVFSTNPMLEEWYAHGRIELEALAYIRGRTFHNTFLIIDEAQNLSLHELKTILTRVGENTKIVLTGDIAQIDNTKVDMFTNALTYAIERFKTYPIAGHVSLRKGERSALATLSSEIL